MRRSVRFALIVSPIVLIQSIGALPALASAGDLDTSFSQDGLLLRRDIPGGIYSLATQPDGKVVAAGVGSAPGEANTMVLARFNSDGSLDHTFSGDGVKRTSFAGDGYAWSVALLPDGDIVAGGQGAPPQGGPSNFLIVRFNADGTLDRGFSADGKAQTHFGTQSSAMIDLAVQPDGKIVGVGYTCCDDPRFALARYMPDGSLDPAFGNGGRLTTQFGQFATASGVAVLPGGKIMVSGERDNTHGAVARYLPDGTLDTSFGGNGRAITPNLNYEGGDLAISSDGSAILSGTLHGSSTNHIALTRFTPDGTFDTSFGTNGLAVAQIPESAEGDGTVAIQPDGKIVATGSRDLSNAFTAARWNADGTPDADFGDSGAASASFHSGRSNSVGLTLTPDGGILTGGLAGSGGTDVWALAKFTGS